MEKKELSFEQSMQELQAVVERLEAGQAPLEESLRLYERGIELVRLCNRYLDTAEQRIVTVQLDGTRGEDDGQ